MISSREPCPLAEMAAFFAAKCPVPNTCGVVSSGRIRWMNCRAHVLPGRSCPVGLDLSDCPSTVIFFAANVPVPVILVCVAVPGVMRCTNCRIHTGDGSARRVGTRGALVPVIEHFFAVKAPVPDTVPLTGTARVSCIRCANCSNQEGPGRSRGNPAFQVSCPAPAIAAFFAASAPVPVRSIVRYIARDTYTPMLPVNVPV